MFRHRTVRFICKFYTLKSMEVNLMGYVPKYFLYARHLNLGVTCRRKMFVEYENKFAYGLLQSKGHINRMPHEPCVTAIAGDLSNYIAQDWSEKTPQQLFEAFRSLTKYSADNKLCISDTMFDNYIDNLTDNIKYLSDDQLATIFQDMALWPQTESPKTRNFIEVWAALDDACVARMKDWQPDKKLWFAELMFHLNIARFCDYTNKCVQRLIGRANNLTPSQIIQTCFYLSVLRSSPLDKHNIEVHLQHNFSRFTIEDLAVISMGLFKSKTPIRNMELVSMIAEKIIVNVDEIDSVSLAALLKLVRYSMKFTSNDVIYRLLSALEGQVPRLSLMACVHVGLLGTSTQTLHKQCLSAVAGKVAAQISTARIKDLERLTLVLANFDYHVPDINFVELVLEEIRKPTRQDEIEKYGRVYACCINYATMMGHYPEDLFDKVLDPQFIKETYKATFGIGREILSIDNTIQINCPKYTGNRLPRKTLSFLAKKYTDYVPNEDYKCQYNVSERLVLDVTATLRKLCGGKSYVYGDHALTHYQRGDIFICNDKDGNAVDISSHFPITPFGPAKYPPTEDTWIVFVIAARNAFIRGTGDVIGSFKTKCRELRKIGYKPAIVSWYIWDKLPSDEEKTDYLKQLIKDAVKT